jgi:peptide deformylase
MELLTVPNPVLTRVCTPVLPGWEMSQNVTIMTWVMRQHGGCGLAAPQIGWLKRVFIVSESGTGGDLRIYLNPRLSEGEGEAVGVEGCLSIPGKTFRVPRFTKIRIKAVAPNGDKIDEVVRDQLARIVQHEYDHLDGLLIDRFELVVLDVTDARAENGPVDNLP